LEYAELEEGKRRFDAAQLAKLCKLLQVSVVIFFGELAKIDLRTYYKPNLLVYYASNDNAARRSRP